MSVKGQGVEDESREILLSSAALSVRGSGARLLTDSFSTKQCSIRRCAKRSGDIYCRFVVSVSSLKVFPSSSMSMNPKPGDGATNEEFVITLHDDTLELRFKFDDVTLYSLWQRALGEAIATAHCTEAFTTFSPTGRLSYYRLNRTMYACSGLVPFEHRCMNRGRFLLTARRQLSELLLRFRDAGSAFVAQSEVACLLRYCKQDPLLSCDSDVALMEKILTLMPAAASYSSSSLAAKQADERIDEVLACAALDELQDEQNGLFAYGTQSPSADSPIADSSLSSSSSALMQGQGQDEQRDGILEEKLAAMQGDLHAALDPAPVSPPASPSRASAMRPQTQALSPLLTLSSLTSETPFRPLAQQQQEQLDADFALAMAVQINDCSSPLPTALVTFCSAAPAPAPAPAPASASAISAVAGSQDAGAAGAGKNKDKDGPRSPSPTSVTQIAALGPLPSSSADLASVPTESSSSSAPASSSLGEAGEGRHSKTKISTKGGEGGSGVPVKMQQALALAGALALLLLACACSYRLGRSAHPPAPHHVKDHGQGQRKGQWQGWGHDGAEVSFEFFSPAPSFSSAPAQAQTLAHTLANFQATSARRGPVLHSSRPSRTTPPTPRRASTSNSNSNSKKAESSGSSVSLVFSPVAALRRLFSRVLGWVGALVFTLPGSPSSKSIAQGQGRGDGGLFAGVAMSLRRACGIAPDDNESWLHKDCSSISCHEDFPSPVTGLMG